MPRMSSSSWFVAFFTLVAALGFGYVLSSRQSAGGEPQSITAVNEKDGTSGDEVDRRLPPPKDKCSTCSKKAEDVGKATLRCSQCKNAFYCSEECQKKEWKQHKYNCSLFPQDGIKPANVPLTNELVDEVRRVDEILDAWFNKLFEVAGEEANIPKINGADLPEALPLCQLKLSSLFEYNRVPQLQRYPFRNPLIQIARLYLIHLVATHQSPDTRKVLADEIDSIPLPPYLAPLYGPKVINRPADLSPGEYDAFTQITPLLMDKPEKVGLEAGDRGRWIALTIGLKKLWNATLVQRPSPSR